LACAPTKGEAARARSLSANGTASLRNAETVRSPWSLMPTDLRFYFAFHVVYHAAAASLFPVPFSLSLSLSLSRISVASSFARSSLEAAFRKLKRAYGEATAMASALSSVASRRD